MAYKKYYKEFYEYTDKFALTATCYSQDTNYGFHHCCEELHIQTPKNVYRTETKNFCQYYNRTWECYKFQSVLLDALFKLKEKYTQDEEAQEIFNLVKTYLKNNVLR